MTTITHDALHPLHAALRLRQPILAGAGSAMLTLVGAGLLAMLVDPRTINGLSVWVKPTKFAAAFVILFWTLAWAWTALAPAWREGKAARFVLWGVLVTAWAEQAWMTARAAGGLPSHFVEGGMAGLLYPLMGVVAMLLVGFCALLGVLILLWPDRSQPRPWRIAIGLGLLVGGLLGGFTGYGMAASNASRIGGLLNDAGNLPPFFWSRDGGDLRIAHFLGIHAMQAIPLLALLGANVRVVCFGAAGWSALTLSAHALARAGVALSP